MKAGVKKIIFLLVAAALLFGSGRFQSSLNHDRDALGLTRTAVLDNAPPMLAFTTVALGGFRGLISNFLWIRANDLQQDDKFFEAAQLADWITKLEPTFAQVWLFQGWNMAYNISVKFKDFPDRWRWVEHGIELLRDEGLRYNPNDMLIHRELAWFFQHKMGANLDDANMYYKQQWADEMMPFFGPEGTNFIDLLSPQSTNAVVLREKYKIDPAFAQKIGEKYGPLDWRLPEAHAIYWGASGLDAAAKNPGKIKADDVITLRRIVYQSMLQAFHHGHIISNPYTRTHSLGPNLNLTAKVDDAYEEMMREDVQNREHISVAHRNFLRDAVYFLYEDNRLTEARQWFRVLGERYPNKPIIDGNTNSLPRNISLEEYAVAKVQEDIDETSQEKVTAALLGLIRRSYFELIADNEDRYQNYRLLVKRVYENYVSKAYGYKGDQRIPLPSYESMNRQVVTEMLDPRMGLPYEARAVLRTRLNLPAETVSTNAPVMPVNPLMESPTNSAATNGTARVLP